MPPYVKPGLENLWSVIWREVMRCVGLLGLCCVVLAHFACDVATLRSSVISSSFNSISMVNIEDRSLFFFKERNIFCLHVAIKITLFTIEKKG